MQTNVATQPDVQWACEWQTMPEVLQDKGVSWKVYTPSNVRRDPADYAALTQYPTWSPSFYEPSATSELLGLSDNVLPYFKSFEDTTSPLYNLAFMQTFPNTFVADIAAGTLPSVSWIIPPLGFDEHPAASPMNGQYFTSLVLDALVANPEVWSKTALFLMYDENDGWFDHVAAAGGATRHARRVADDQQVPEGRAAPGHAGLQGPAGTGASASPA